MVCRACNEAGLCSILDVLVHFWLNWTPRLAAHGWPRASPSLACWVLLHGACALCLTMTPNDSRATLCLCGGREYLCETSLTGEV